jgi:ribosomal subunit interface protein
MHIKVAGKQVETGDALKVHVAEGLQTITRKYFDHALEAQVTFSKGAKGRPFACDINIHAGRGLSMRGEGEGTDAHRAFDVAAEHIAKRLRRYRRRMNEHARSFAEERAPDLLVAESEPARDTTLRQDEGEEEAPAGATAEANGQAGNGHDHGAVVAETEMTIRRLTVSEAVMHLDLTAREVIMFRNRANNQLNVVYRRSDGHVGWIDPGA